MNKNIPFVKGIIYDISVTYPLIKLSHFKLEDMYYTCNDLIHIFKYLYSHITFSSPYVTDTELAILYAIRDRYNTMVEYFIDSDIEYNTATLDIVINKKYICKCTRLSTLTKYGIDVMKLILHQNGIIKNGVYFILDK